MGVSDGEKKEEEKGWGLWVIRVWGKVGRGVREGGMLLTKNSDGVMQGKVRVW